MLDVQPDDVVLEIGCGGGVAVALICDRLADGHILAVDRSATMIVRAQRRNSDCVAAGRALEAHRVLQDAVGSMIRM